MSEWISVETELPDGDYEVLVCDEQLSMSVAYFDENWWLACWETISANNITHWRKLPQPPEVERSGE